MLDRTTSDHRNELDASSSSRSSRTGRPRRSPSAPSPSESSAQSGQSGRPTRAELVEEISRLRVEITRLEHLAATDALTGLRNHRAFEDDLRREFARARRVGATLSLLLIDVDHFKRFNDR